MPSSEKRRCSNYRIFMCRDCGIEIEIQDIEIRINVSREKIKGMFRFVEYY